MKNFKKVLFAAIGVLGILLFCSLNPSIDPYVSNTQNLVLKFDAINTFGGLLQI